MTESKATNESRIGKLARHCFERVDASALAYLRVVVGLFGVLWAYSFLVDNHYDVVFVQPRAQLKYGGWEWVPLWPGRGIYWHFVIALVAGFGLMVGMLTRLCAGVLCLAITYTLLVERCNYSNQDYLLACTAGLLCFVPSSGWWSLDSQISSRIWPRFAFGQGKTCWRWQLWLVRFQLGVPLIFASLARLTSADWFRGQPLELLLRQQLEQQGFAADQLSPALVTGLALGLCVFELSIIPLLMLPATRIAAGLIAAAVLIAETVFLNVGMYPLLLLAGLLVFLPPAAIRRRIGLFFGSGLSVSGQPMVPLPEIEQQSRRAVARTGFCLAIAYCVIQLAVPLRGWIYPGDVNWNERGSRFSWRLLVRDKQSLTHFLLFDDQRNEFLVLPINSILTATQLQQAAMNPELIRQAAVRLASEAETEFGVQDCRIHVLALVSLNGRRPVPIIDPAVDMTRVRRGTWKDEWVLEDPGEFSPIAWREPTETWWKVLDLPAPFRQRLQGRTPSELDEYLRQLGQPAPPNSESP